MLIKTFALSENIKHCHHCQHAKTESAYHFLFYLIMLLLQNVDYSVSFNNLQLKLQYYQMAEEIVYVGRVSVSS